MLHAHDALDGALAPDVAVEGVQDGLAGLGVAAQLAVGGRLVVDARRARDGRVEARAVGRAQARRDGPLVVVVEVVHAHARRDGQAVAEQVDGVVEPDGGLHGVERAGVGDLARAHVDGHVERVAAADVSVLRDAVVEAQAADLPAGLQPLAPEAREVAALRRQHGLRDLVVGHVGLKHAVARRDAVEVALGAVRRLDAAEERRAAADLEAFELGRREGARAVLGADGPERVGEHQPAEADVVAVLFAPVVLQRDGADEVGKDAEGGLAAAGLEAEAVPRVQPDGPQLGAAAEVVVGDALDVAEVGVVVAFELLGAEQAGRARRARRHGQAAGAAEARLGGQAAVEHRAVGRRRRLPDGADVVHVQHRGELAAVADGEAAGVERQALGEVAVDQAEPFLLALPGAERAVDLEAVDKELVLVVRAAAHRVGVRELVVARHAELGLDGAQRVRERRRQVADGLGRDDRDAGLGLSGGRHLSLAERERVLGQPHVDGRGQPARHGHGVAQRLVADEREADEVAAFRDREAVASVARGVGPEAGPLDDHVGAGDGLAGGGLSDAAPDFAPHLGGGVGRERQEGQQQRRGPAGAARKGVHRHVGGRPAAGRAGGERT